MNIRWHKNLPPEPKNDLLGIEQSYNELIMAVESKFPGETRHDTALRYIKDRENGTIDLKTQKENES